MNKKLAVFFPGIGYHNDKPLLYYSRKLASEAGFECIRVDYNGFASGIKGNMEKMKEALETAYSQTELILSSVDWKTYEDIVFISKSIGTVVAARYAKKYNINCRNVYMTPLAETFLFEPKNGIAFHGIADTWADTKIIKEKCPAYNLKLYIIPQADHSLETADTITNIKIIQDTICTIKDYLTLAKRKA